MNPKEIHENFNKAPLGLKLIIVLYGVFAVLDIIYLIEAFSLDRLVALILSLLTTIGFLFQWEAVRLIYRLLIGFFFVASVVMIFVSEKFRATAIDNAGYWGLIWIVPALMFYYLGRHDIKSLFISQVEDDPTKAVDTDAE